MKNIRECLQLTIMLLFFSSLGCKAQPQPQITGVIELHPEWKNIVYLIQPRNFSEIAANFLGQVIDSASIDQDGHFAFSDVPITNQKLLLQLVVQKTTNRYPNQIVDTLPAQANYMPFVLSEGNPVDIYANASAFQKSFVFNHPSVENKALSSLRDVRLSAFQKWLANMEQGSHSDSLMLERENSYQRFSKTLMTFADTTSCIEAAMVSIRWISPTGDFERLPEFIHDQCQKWQHDQPDHPLTGQLCRVAEQNNLPVMIGDQMPDFSLPLSTGDTMMLYHSLGKRLTIVDIWASWCAPCRKENRTVLTPLWSAYKDQGLQIIGYSIDNNMSSWNSAIEKDAALWIHASHLTGDATPFLSALRISTIPANFILDAQGKIIAKNLHGKELIDFVDGYLNK